MEKVIISEIMFTTGNGQDSQWIELYNLSKTDIVNLKNWKLKVKNFNSIKENLQGNIDFTLSLPETYIQPAQSILIANYVDGNSKPILFPPNYIINIWWDRDLRNTVSMPIRSCSILSSIGFYISIYNSDKKLIDEVGNLRHDMNVGDEPSWVLKSNNNEAADRRPMVRLSGTENSGLKEKAWSLSDRQLEKVRSRLIQDRYNDGLKEKAWFLSDRQLEEVRSNLIQS